ncbi:MAG: toxin TcdB middle/N-terminal domain-containing protein, partial [Steroidobacteraceae bacterium]
MRFGSGHGFNPQEVDFRRVVEIPDQTAIESDDVTLPSRSIRDVNGDGRLDYLSSHVGTVFLQEKLANHTGARTEPPANLLTRAIDPMGGVVEFSYASSAQMQTSEGLPANPASPLVKPVVVELTHRDGRSGTPAIVTEFWYGDGVFDSAEKEFRGFGTVETTEIEGGASGTQSTSTFRTDRECANALASRVVHDGSAVLTRETNAYHPPVTGGGALPAQWAKCLLEASLVEAVEGSEPARKAARTTWTYDAHYNPLELREYGEWNPVSNQNVAGDERFTFYTYATASTHPNVVSRVKTVEVRDSFGNVYGSRRYCYELSSCANAAAGVVLEVRDKLTDVTLDPPVVNQERTVAKFSYAPNGNLEHSTGPATPDDANGLRTTLSYDQDYGTFPTTVAVGSDLAQPLVTTLSYSGCASGLAPPPALGLPCGVTAPGQPPELSGYDVFGRVVRQEGGGG